MTIMVFGYLILISHRFLCFLLSFVSFEKIYQTLKIVFDHISKNVKVQYFRLSFLKCGQTRSFEFDVLHQYTDYDFGYFHYLGRYLVN